MAGNTITKASSDYKTIVELLTRVDAGKTVEISSDGSLTKDEIIDLFNGDDQKLQLADLDIPIFNQSPKLFGQINDLLQNHRGPHGDFSGIFIYFNLPGDELKQAVTGFCKTGIAKPASLAYVSSFLTRAIWEDAGAARFVPREMFEAHEMLSYNIVDADPMALEYIPIDLVRGDPYIALNAVRNNGEALQFVPEDVQFVCPEIAYSALMGTPSALAYVAPEFQIAHPEVVQAMWGISGDGALADVAPEFWKAHPETADRDWDALRGRPMDLGDPDSLMAWLTWDGMNLQYVPDEVQETNPGAVFAALLQNPEALQFTSAGFQLQNTEFVRMTLFKTEEPATFYLTEELQVADKEALRYVISRKTSLAYLTPMLARVSPQTYDECVKKAIDWNGTDLQFVPKAYLEKHPELITLALQNDSMALQFTDATWQIAHPTATLKAVEWDWHALEFLTPGFRSYHPKTTLKAVESAVESDPHAIQFVSEEFQMMHEDLIYKAIDDVGDQQLKEEEPILYCLSDGFLRAHPNVLTTVIAQHPSRLLPLIDAINEFCQGVSGPHQILVEAATSLWGFDASSSVGPPEHEISSIKQNLAAFLYDKVDTNMGFVEPLLTLNPDVLARVWKFVKIANNSRLSFPPGVMDSPQAFQEFLSQHTEFPERFHSLKTVHEVFVKGEDPSDTRPVALLLYNKDDWNGAFAGRVIDDIAADGRFHVVYREIDSDDDVESALQEFGPVHTLVLAGHGSKTSLQLGHADSEGMGNYVDTDDYDRCDEELERKFFIPGGQILLYACSNGEGGSEDDNLHRTMTWTFPHVSVYSSPLPSNIRELSFDADKHLKIELWDTTPVVSAPSLQP